MLVTWFFYMVLKEMLSFSYRVIGIPSCCSYLSYFWFHVLHVHLPCVTWGGDSPVVHRLPGDTWGGDSPVLRRLRGRTLRW